MPPASVGFNQVARQLAEGLGRAANVVIDVIIYAKVQPLRAPNSRHPKTGLHKRRMTLDELTQLSIERIVELAREPLAFDLPIVSTRCDRAATDWSQAVQRVEQEAEAVRQRRASVNGAARINRATLDFIRDGAATGDRHRLLFSAAANLGEFGCPSELAHELLTEAGLDSGLSPSEVRRQIECGLNHHQQMRNPS